MLQQRLRLSSTISRTPVPERAAIDFLEVTELAKDLVSREQIDRLERRYLWARPYCVGKDVHEFACGTAQGCGVLAAVARSFAASDVSKPMLERARAHYGDRIDFRKLDAQQSGLPDASLDVIILFEALYYLPDADAFFREAARLLRPRGVLLLATANKDLFDFNPSPHSREYLGVKELGDRIGRAGFTIDVFGDTPLAGVAGLQKALRPVKNLASRWGLIPRSMNAKKMLKRLVFGKLVPMPTELVPAQRSLPAPTPLPASVADRQHKVLLCAATVAH